MFRRNVAALTGATIGGQCILLAATPILTRYFGAEAFGALATYSAIYGVLSGVGTLKFDLAVPAQPKIGHAYAVGAAALWASASAVVLLLLILVGLSSTAKWALPAWAWLLPPSIGLVGLYAVAHQWAARERTYRRYALSLIVGPAVNVSIATLLGHFWRDDGAALVLAYFFGLTASAIVIVSPGRIGHHVWKTLRSLGPIKRVLLMAWKMREYPQYVLPTHLAVAAAGALPVFVLGWGYSQEEVGYYAVAMRFLLSPSALVGGAISEVLRSEMFRLQRLDQSYRWIVKRVLRVGLVGGAPFLILAWLFGGDLLVFVVGQDFLPSGQLVPYLAIGAVALIVIQPLQSVFLVSGRQKLGLVAQCLLTVVPSVAIYLAAQKGESLAMALSFYAASMVVIAAVYVVLVLKVAGKDKSEFLQPRSG